MDSWPESHVMRPGRQEDGLPPHSERLKDKIASSMKDADLGLEFQLRRKSPDFSRQSDISDECFKALKISIPGMNGKW